MTSTRALACAMAVAMRCRCVAERQPQTKSCTAVETIDLTCGLHVETMMVSKSWSVVSQDQIIEQTRPLAVALASFPALRSGTGSALRSTQPVVTARPAPELIVIRGGFVQRAAAVARATSRAAYLNINAGRPATPEHETQRAVTRRSAYYTAVRRPLASRASPSGSLAAVRNRRGARRARSALRALVHVRTPTRGSGTHSFLDSSHVRSVTASYCHSPTTAGRLSR